MVQDKIPAEEPRRDVKPAPRKRELYSSEEPPPYYYPLETGNKQPRGDGGGWKTWVMQAIVAVIVVFAMSMTGVGNWLTKSDFEKNISTLQASIDSLNKNYSTLSTTVTNLPQTLNASVNDALSKQQAQVNTQLSTFQNTMNDEKTRVDNAVNLANNANNQMNSQTNSLNSLSGKIDALNGTVTSLQTKLTEDEATITGQDARIKELETSGSSGGGTSNSPITVTKIQVINTVFNYDSTNDETIVTFGVKFYLTNSESADLEDIELEVPITVEASHTIKSWGKIVVTGGSWHLANMYKEDTYAEATLTGDSISLDSNKTNEKITVRMTVEVEGDISDIDVSVDEDDVDITDWSYE